MSVKGSSNAKLLAKKKLVPPPLNAPFYDDELLEIPEPQRSELQAFIGRSVDEQVYWKIAELRDKTWQTLYRKRKENIIQICDTIASAAARKRSNSPRSNMGASQRNLSNYDVASQYSRKSGKSPKGGPRQSNGDSLYNKVLSKGGNSGRKSKGNPDFMGLDADYPLGDITQDNFDKSHMTNKTGKSQIEKEEEAQEIMDHSDLYLNDPVVAAHYAKTGLGYGANMPYNVPFGAYPGAYNYNHHEEHIARKLTPKARKAGARNIEFAESSPFDHVDPIHTHVDPISVSMQERVKFGGHTTSVVKRPYQTPPPFFFYLSEIGAPVEVTKRAILMHEVHRQEHMGHKEKATYITDKRWRTRAQRARDVYQEQSVKEILREQEEIYRRERDVTVAQDKFNDPEAYHLPGGQPIAPLLPPMEFGHPYGEFDGPYGYRRPYPRDYDVDEDEEGDQTNLNLQDGNLDYYDSDKK